MFFFVSIVIIEFIVYERLRLCSYQANESFIFEKEFKGGFGSLVTRLGL